MQILSDTELQQIESHPTFKVSGPGMVVLSMLADAQDLIRNGDSDGASYLLDRAKTVIMHYRLGLPSPRS